MKNRRKHGAALRVVVEESGHEMASYGLYDENGQRRASVEIPMPSGLPDNDSHSAAARLLTRRAALHTDEPSVPYCYLFGQADEAELPSAESVLALGNAMGEAARHPPVDPEEEGSVPVAFTYFGQFVFHDLSYLPSPSINNASRVNKRSPALDLDSIFAPPDIKDSPVDCPSHVGPLPLGCAYQSVSGVPLLAEDLPRTTSGEPVIADDRNDSNLPLAQIHMAMLRFHNSVATMFPSLTDEEARNITRLHFQSVVLHDYLPRVIDCDVYKDVLKNGPILLRKSKTSALHISLEFALACARFGHSMVRTTYGNWNKNHHADLHGFWSNTSAGEGGRLEHGKIRRDWLTDWPAILDISNSLFGEARPDATAPIMAARIDTLLAQPLADIRPDVLPFNPLNTNLALRTLQSGYSYRIRSAQQVSKTIRTILSARGDNAAQLSAYETLSDHELLSGESERVRDALCGDEAGRPRLLDATPLWFYTLKEAAVRNAGKRLGPVGGRIVMETVYAAVQEARPSILDDSIAPWMPTERLRPRNRSHYGLSDLVEFAGLTSRIL